MSSLETAAQPDTILVNRSPGETRYALLARGELIEIVYRRDGDMHPGAVYLGRVGARVPQLDAVFVDVGTSSAGVLKAKSPFPTEGTPIAVGVVVPPRAGKGPELKRAAQEIENGSGKVPRVVAAAPEPVADWWTRHASSIKRIVCEPRSEATRLQTMLDPGAPVVWNDSAAALFEDEGIEDAIEAALSPRVPLPCGGAVTIEPTAGAVVIDVDSGAAPPVVANNEAISAVAVELRRRNISGHILIDVIPAKGRAALPRLLGKLLNDDPAPARVAGLTPLGMLELTRARTDLSLAETLLDPDGRPSARSVALQVLRRAVREAFRTRAARVSLAVSEDVYGLLTGALRPAVVEAHDTGNVDVELAARADFVRERFEVLHA
ncbi:MAG: ribonuclease E/G [Rhodospirillaceae bacterium]